MSSSTDVTDREWLQSLQAQRLITPETVQSLLELQRSTGRALLALLQADPLSDEPALAAAIAQWQGVPWVNLDDVTVDPAVIQLIPARVAESYRLLPLTRDQEQLVVAVGDGTFLPMLEHLRATLQMSLRPQLTSARQWRRAFLRHYGVGAGTVEAMAETHEVATSAPLAADDALVASAEEVHSVAQLVQQLLVQACREGATDLHIDAFRDHVRIRLRIDGVLYDVPAAPGLRRLQAAIISRLKVMAHLDIAERRLPQDGRFRVAVEGEDLDVRLSTLPTVHGESVDLRLLSRKALYRLAQLGLFPDQLTALEQLLAKPHGILFVTGPTGSGKTTTLYAYLRQFDPARANIVTIEDPVEQELDGITQLQVHPKIDLTFARGLRSVLRHDPDVIMVGEVRDAETAEIAIRSALTGHLVFSTLHTNDAASGVARLLDMGIEPYLLTSSVECFIAQRLVRIVCRQCRRNAPQPPPEVLSQLGASDARLSATFVEGSGCAACKGTGYHGRTGIFELLLVTDALRELILRHASAQELKRVAIQQGMRTLAHAGWAKALQGVTTVAEVLRVT